MNNLQNKIESIRPLNQEAVKSAWKRIDGLSKPIGSLGALEEIAARIAGITGKVKNSINKKNIIIMCADNGVVDEGVSACPQSVTATVTNNFTKDITGVCVLAKHAESELTIVDIGVNADFANPKIINEKVAYGTKNISKGPAMTREEAVKCIEIGIKTVERLAAEGYDLLGTGEMGIGNTTTSAAVLSVLSGLHIDLAVGKGAGLTEKQFENKKRIAYESIKVNNPDAGDAIDVLSKVGGFDIAGLCGCFLGAALCRVPIVIDGYIASVAALCAYRLNPLVKEYIFASHLSAEPGAKYVMKELGLEPMVNLKMRLGEGSGCPIAFNIIDAALFTINNMATFEEANIDKEDYIDIRLNNSPKEK